MRSQDLPYLSVPLEDARDLVAERTEQTVDHASRPLLEGAAMDGAGLRRNRVAILEVFAVDRTALDRPKIRHAAEVLGLEAGGHGEIRRRQPVRDALHEIGPDWQRHPRAVRIAADGRRLIEADPHARDH